MEPREPPVGCRVLLGGQHLATVRYVGPIDGQQDIWVGIEYDEPGRGKHDGSHGDRRYFECAHGPTAGSFVRLAKLLEAADLGRTLAAAAAERYAVGAAAEPLFVATAGNRRVAVELVAPEASSRRASGGGGVAAVLAAHRIAAVGPAAQLQATLPSLTELDLSDNLIASWSFVAELAAALPSLRTLNLSGNRLALPSLAAAAPRPPALAGLRVLALNGCAVSWPQVVAAAQQLPDLRELRLCRNRVASLRLPAESSGVVGGAAAEGSAPGGEELLVAAFPRLELLDLDDNALSSWAEVVTLRSLACLRSLLLSGNELEAVAYPGGFAALRCLLLGGNRLASWAAVDALDAFPALTEARLSDNPVTAATPSAARYQCIARVSRLAVLNASAVSSAERWDAEVNYLRLVTDELAAAAEHAAGGSAADAQAARAAVLAANPRFGALTQKYGELTPAAPKAATGTALASGMALISVTHGGKVLQKKLPVGKLKLMLERLLRVKAAQQALLLVPPEGSGTQPEDITDEDARELRYFDACDGCRLEVSAADPSTRAAALAAAQAAGAAAHAARMEQQEKTIRQFRAVEQLLMA